MRNHPTKITSAGDLLHFRSSSFSVLFLLLIFIGFQTPANAQCPLVCKGMVNVSLGTDGKALITIYNVMNNPQPSCIPNYQITLMDSKGKPVPNPLTCAFIGQSLMYSVKDITNNNSCWGNLKVEDKLPPILICTDVTLDCNQSTEVDSVAKVLVFDNCDTLPQILSQGEIITSIDCNNQAGILYTITRTWIAKDSSGNYSIPCVQKISIKKPNLIDIKFPINYTLANGNFLDCADNNTSPDTLGFPTYHGRPLTLMCKIFYSYKDSIVARCNGSENILRTWTVLDCCNNNFITHLQLIQKIDTTPPKVICPPDFTVNTKAGECTADVTIPKPFATDNCSDSISIKITSGTGIFGSLSYGPYKNVPPGFYEVTYTICDDCSNCTFCQVAFEVKDAELPTVICNNNITISVDGTGKAMVSVSDINNGSYDNCCLDSLDIKLMGLPDSTYGQTIEFDCKDVNKSFLVILRAMDCHGNVNFCMSSVKITDTSPPAIICPADLTIYCTSAIIPDSTGYPIPADICGIDTIYFKDTKKLTACNTGKVMRLWTAIDSSGNLSTCLQLITVIDTTAPVITFPGDITINCALSPDSTLTGHPNASDDCSLFLISHVDKLIVDPLNCDHIERTWNVFNLCDSTTLSQKQNILLFDNISPVWVNNPGSLDVSFDCSQNVIVPIPTALDNCTTLSVVIVNDNTNLICQNHYTRTITYRAFDGCQNASVPFLVNIKVNDTIPPVLLNCPNDITINLAADSCSKFLSFPVIKASDNCGVVSVSNNSPYSSNKNSGNISGNYPAGKHTVMVFATDACGNRDTCTVHINIRDVTPPIADCADITICLIGSIQKKDSLFIITPELIKKDYNFFDNCTPVIFSADPDTFTCASIGPPPKLFTITLKDTFGNTTICHAKVLVVDSFNVCASMFNQGYFVMGNLATPSMLPIKQSNVELYLNNTLHMVKTDSMGYYMYPHVPEGTDVSIKPIKDDDYLNGVDILDVLYLTRYLLGKAPLPHPYSKLAADVNESHTLSVADLGEIKRLIIHTQKSFSSNKSWKFIDAKCQQDILNNELSASLPQELNIPKIKYHSLLNNFISVKLGDIDFSSKSYFTSSLLEVRDKEKAMLEVPEIVLEKNKSYTIDVSLKDPFLWSGIQAALKLPDFIEVEDIQLGNMDNMTNDNFSFTHDHEALLSFLWSNDDQIKSTNQNQLIKLSFKSLTDGKLSEILKLEETNFDTKAYDQSYRPASVSLVFSNNQSNYQKQQTRIYANRPNPFTAETLWPLFLENNNTSVKLVISSVDGKMILNKTYEFTEGYQELKLNSNELPGKGCYLYQIITNDTTQSGKFILQ